jgi:protein-S-isoprenylcysteine O-methyltransferase Ste14
MSYETAVRVASLYLPCIVALLVGLLTPRKPRMFAACLLSTLWAICALLVLQRINLAEQWWTFGYEKASVLGMPLEFFFGWTVLWGIIPPLVFRKLEIPEVLAIMGAIDIWLMPLSMPAIKLGSHWLLGELAALLLVLLPAFCIARWTIDQTHLAARATLQVAISGLLFLYLLPEVAFALRPVSWMSSVWEPLLRMPSLLLQAALQVILLAAVPGVSAVCEFVQRGFGTPIPYDPPKRLVTSGIYRYCASPMQLSCAIVMLLWAGLLRNPWVVVAALVAAIYSAGIAHWDEDRDLTERFGDAWLAYRAAAPAWRMRWKPYHPGPPAKIYFARTCGSCSEVRRWVETRNPVGLEFLDAETLPDGSIRRLRYDPGDGTAYEEGIDAFARALEHLNFGWAYCGMTIRLPVVHQAVQLLLDAVGFGPRTIPGACGVPVPVQTGNDE